MGKTLKHIGGFFYRLWAARFWKWYKYPIYVNKDLCFGKDGTVGGVIYFGSANMGKDDGFSIVVANSDFCNGVNLAWILSKVLERNGIKYSNPNGDYEKSVELRNKQNYRFIDAKRCKTCRQYRSDSDLDNFPTCAIAKYNSVCATIDDNGVCDKWEVKE